MIHLDRRTFLTGAAAAAGTIIFPSHSRAIQDEKKIVKVGRLKQSLCRWCYGKIPLPDLCKAAKEMGLTAIDLLTEKDWPVVQEHGMVCSMVSGFGGSIPKGWNDPANHDGLLKSLEAGIPKVAKAGFPNAITFFGNRVKDMSDQQMIDNCVEGLKKVKPIAEENKVMVCVELLNSKVDHKGYFGDKSEIGLKVVKAVGSPYIKLLYDIYHMQIMEGDVIRTIRESIDQIAHFHTGGVPGRHELDDTQELQWRSVAKAIADKGYKGFVAHEFIPTRDPLTSLREAVALCDV